MVECSHGRSIRIIEIFPLFWIDQTKEAIVERLDLVKSNSSVLNHIRNLIAIFPRKDSLEERSLRLRTVGSLQCHWHTSRTSDRDKGSLCFAVSHSLSIFYSFDHPQSINQSIVLKKITVRFTLTHLMRQFLLVVLEMILEKCHDKIVTMIIAFLHP